MKRHLMTLLSATLFGCNNYIPEVNHISLGLPQSNPEAIPAAPESHAPTSQVNSPPTTSQQALPPPVPAPISQPIDPTFPIIPTSEPELIENSAVNLLHQIMFKEEKVREWFILKAIELILYSPKPLSSKRDIPNLWFKSKNNLPFLLNTPNHLSEIKTTESHLLSKKNPPTEIEILTKTLKDNPHGKYQGLLINDTYIVTPNTPPSQATKTQLQYQEGSLDQLNVKFSGQSVKALENGTIENSYPIWMGQEENGNGIQLWNQPPILHNQIRLVDSWSTQNLKAIAQVENSSSQYVALISRLNKKFQESTSIALILEYFEDLKTIAQSAQDIRLSSSAQTSTISSNVLTQSATQLIEKEVSIQNLGTANNPTSINFEFLPIVTEQLSDQAKLDINFISFSMNFPGILDVFKSSKINLTLSANCQSVNFRTRGQIALVLKEFNTITTAVNELKQLVKVWNNKTDLLEEESTLGTICHQSPFCLDLNPAENQFKLLYNYFIDSQTEIPYNPLLNQALGLFGANPQHSLITCLNPAPVPSSLPTPIPTIAPTPANPTPSVSPTATPSNSASPTPPESSPSPTESSSSPPITIHDIIFNGNFFSPTARTIQSGEKVTWKNTSDKFHLLKSNEGLFSVQLLAAHSGSYAFTFTQAGTYKFTIGLKQVIITVQ